MTLALSYKIEIFFLWHPLYVGIPERFHLKCNDETTGSFLIKNAIFPSYRLFWKGSKIIPFLFDFHSLWLVDFFKGFHLK